MLDSIVWILAGITAWCVASLALALIVGPLVRRTEQTRGGAAARPVAATRLIAPVQIPR